MKMVIDCDVHISSFLLNKRDNHRFPEAKGPLGLPEGEYEFRYDYPLRTTAKFKRKLTEKTSARNILRFGARDYKRIYDAEDREAGDPGYIHGMFNRESSDGPYGIWGHYMGDLFFESIYIDPKRRVITFGVGS